MNITELLDFSLKTKASDLHLSAGLPPMFRIDGDIRRVDLPVLSHQEVIRLRFQSAACNTEKACFFHL